MRAATAKTTGVALWEEDSPQASLGTHKTKTQANSLSGLLLSIVAGRLKTRLATPVLTVWETLTMLWPPKTTRPARQHPQELPYLPAAMGIPFTATLPIFPSSHRDGCQAASVSRAATWLGRRRGHSPAQNAVFREGPYAECAFS